MADPPSPPSPPSLPLILARELASNLATPMFLLNQDGMLVYFNDAAEQIIGKPFAEVGVIDAMEFGALLDLAPGAARHRVRRCAPHGASHRVPALRRG